MPTASSFLQSNSCHIGKHPCMVAVMENIERETTASEARRALEGIESAQLAVRNTPWPTWIYPINAALLGALALSALVEQDRRTIVLALMAVIIAINVYAGYRTGVPSAMPTSGMFVAVVAASGACVVAAFVVTEFTTSVWPVVVLAVLAAVGYLIGGRIHRVSTGALS